MNQIGAPWLQVEQNDDKTSRRRYNNKNRDDSSDWDEFGDTETNLNDELDPGSRRSIFYPDSVKAVNGSSNEADVIYYSDVRKMVVAVSEGEARLMEKATTEIDSRHGSALTVVLHHRGTSERRKPRSSLVPLQIIGGGSNLFLTRCLVEPQI